MIQMRLCTIEGCDQKHNAKGLCQFHYVRAVAARRKANTIAWRNRQRDRYNAYMRRFRLGIDQETVDLLTARPCEICQKDLTGLKLCIDHDHKTGRIRGSLCNGCNIMLGRFKDDPEKLREKGHEVAALYLERSHYNDPIQYPEPDPED